MSSQHVCSWREVKYRQRNRMCSAPSWWNWALSPNYKLQPAKLCCCAWNSSMMFRSHNRCLIPMDTLGTILPLIMANSVQVFHQWKSSGESIPEVRGEESIQFQFMGSTSRKWPQSGQFSNSSQVNWLEFPALQNGAEINYWTKLLIRCMINLNVEFTCLSVRSYDITTETSGDGWKKVCTECWAAPKVRI